MPTENIHQHNHDVFWSVTYAITALSTLTFFYKDALAQNTLPGSPPITAPAPPLVNLGSNLMLNRNSFEQYFREHPYEIPIARQIVFNAQFRNALPALSYGSYLDPQRLQLDTTRQKLLFERSPVQESAKALETVKFLIDDLKSRRDKDVGLMPEIEELKKFEEGLSAFGFLAGLTSGMIPAFLPAKASLEAGLEGFSNVGLLFELNREHMRKVLVDRDPALTADERKRRADNSLKVIGQNAQGELKTLWDDLRAIAHDPQLQEDFRKNFGGDFLFRSDDLPLIVERYGDKSPALKELGAKVQEIKERKEKAKQEPTAKELKDVKGLATKAVQEINKNIEPEQGIISKLFTKPKLSEAETQHIEQARFALQEAQSLVNLTALAVGYIDQRAAKVIGITGSTGIQMGLALVTMQTNPITGTYQMVSTLLSLGSLIGGTDVEAERHAQIMQALADISKQITQVHQEVIEARKDISALAAQNAENTYQLSKQLSSVASTLVQLYEMERDHFQEIRDQGDRQQREIRYLRAITDRIRRENNMKWIRDSRRELEDALMQAFWTEARVGGRVVVLPSDEKKKLSLKFAQYGFQTAVEDWMSGRNLEFADVFRDNTFRTVPFSFTVGFAPRLLGAQGANYPELLPQNLPNPEEFLAGAQAYLAFRLANLDYSEGPESTGALLDIGARLSSAQRILQSSELMTFLVTKCIAEVEAIEKELAAHINAIQQSPVVVEKEGKYTINLFAARHVGKKYDVRTYDTTYIEDDRGRVGHMNIKPQITDQNTLLAEKLGLIQLTPKVDLDAPSISPDYFRLSAEAAAEDRPDHRVDGYAAKVKAWEAKQTKLATMRGQTDWKLSITVEASVLKQEFFDKEKDGQDAKLAAPVKSTLAFADIREKYGFKQERRLSNPRTGQVVSVQTIIVKPGWEFMNTYADLKNAWEKDYKFLDVAGPLATGTPGVAGVGGGTTALQARKLATARSNRDKALKDVFSEHAKVEINKDAAAAIEKALQRYFEKQTTDELPSIVRKIYDDEPLSLTKMTVTTETIRYLIASGWRVRLSQAEPLAGLFGFAEFRAELARIAENKISPQAIFEYLAKSKLDLQQSRARIESVANSAEIPLFPTLPETMDQLRMVEIQTRVFAPATTIPASQPASQ